MFKNAESFLREVFYAFILRIMENHCDTACPKYCKIVVSKEVCLHYVTLPLYEATAFVWCCRTKTQWGLNWQIIFSYCGVCLRPGQTCRTLHRTFKLVKKPKLFNVRSRVVKCIEHFIEHFDMPNCAITRHAKAR